MSDAYSSRPWLRHYGNLPQSVIGLTPPSPLARFREVCSLHGDLPAAIYFDAVISYAELDRLSDNFANWLQKSGVKPADRVLIVLNNVPHFMIALLGAWKAQAIPTPANPMYRAKELEVLLADSRPSAIVCHHSHVAIVGEASAAVDLGSPLLAVDPYDFQTEDDTRALPPRAPHAEGAQDFLTAISAPGGEAPPRTSPDPHSIGLVLYTSGTTGPPKGAMLSHQSMAIAGHIARPWTGMADFSRHLAIPPLFHITGLISHCCAAIDAGGALILTYRFEPRVAFDAIKRSRPQFMVAPATVYIALLGLPDLDQESMSSFESVYTGGAPIPPAIVRTFRERTGLTMYPAFGMTETTAGAITAPINSDVPVDPDSGALAIGIPMTDVDVMVLDESGQPAPVGAKGELLMRGPNLMKGYLNKPEETAEALRDGWMHSGDVGFMDENGWFYIVDRKKDIINSAAYKISPSEVEEALYQHPAVREAAVVGVPDAYRGEIVKAVISLKPGQQATAEEIIRHCRDRLAAYKAPRIVDILDDLPKTATGKISRVLLRPAANAVTGATTAHPEPG